MVTTLGAAQEWPARAKKGPNPPVDPLFEHPIH